MNGIEYRYQAQRGVEVVLFHRRPFSHPWHFHTRHGVVGRVLSGTVALADPDGQQILSRGMDFSVPAQRPHRLQIFPDSTVVVVCIYHSDNVSPAPQASPLTPLTQLLISHPEEKLSIPAMAEQIGYSTWHFLRLFKSATGMTPHAFQLICRLALARRLLRAGVPAADAAVSAGFTDQSHLIKVFRHHHGLTPKAFLAAGVRQ